MTMLTKHMLVLLLLMASFVLTGCEGADGSETDGDEVLTDGDEPIETVEACAIADPGHLFTDPDEYDSAMDACAELNFYYEDADDGCYDYGEQNYGKCCPTAFRKGSSPQDPQGFICQAECGDCGAGAPDLQLQWPGPGFGCFLFSGILSKPVPGWHALETPPESMEGNDGCLESWNESDLDFILDRKYSGDTACEDITDLHQCLGAHNPPAHCLAVLGWPLDMVGDTCEESIQYNLKSQADLDRAQFIACRTVYEHKQESDRTHYQGVIRHGESGSCLFFSDIEIRIPAGWSKASCSDCTL